MAKITFIGAGSAVFTRNLLNDLMTYPALQNSEVCLMDIDATRLDLVTQLAKKLVKDAGAKISISSTTNRREALKDAGYVLITIQVGGLDAYEMDIEIPRKYGVEQCVGDTLGPGGLFRGMRHLKVISEICRELEELSPGATVIQYSNPMSIITGAIQRTSPIRSVGICHSVPLTSRALARYMEVPYESLSYKVAGINHMSWFLELRINGEDAYPRLHKAMENPKMYGQDPVRFELMRHFGLFPTESSSHLSEYLPYWRKNQAGIDKLVDLYIDPSKPGALLNFNRECDFDIGRTGGYLRTCQEELKNYFQFMDEQINSQAKTEMPAKYGIKLENEERSVEYGVQIIHSIETGAVSRINGNMPNNGVVTNLPADCTVEVPCLVDKNGIQPCYVGALPTQLAGLIMSNASMQQTAVEGYVQQDRTQILRALKLDPLTAAVCSLEQIDQMFEELVQAQKEWLPAFLV